LRGSARTGTEFAVSRNPVQFSAITMLFVGRRGSYRTEQGNESRHS
jgi:hypothetical protein